MLKTDKQSTRYLGIDQYGDLYPDLVHPRADLLRHFGAKHIDKIYVTDNDGNKYAVGYVVNGHFIDIYEVKPMRKIMK